MILITGAGGHIGNVLTRQLHDNGHGPLRVFVLPDEDISHVSPFVDEVVRGDVRDMQAVMRAVEGCTDVFHAAGIVTISNGRRRYVTDVNHGGTKNVVRACCAKGIKRLVYVSSTDVFMRGGKVIDETCRIDPDRLDSVYAKSKAMATLEVLRSARDGLDAVVVFPSAVLGPNDINRSMTGRAVMQYARGKGAKWYFDGVYDFVDVRDAADGIIRAWQMGGRGESYILSGSACTIKQLLEAVQTCTGRAMIKRRIPTPVFRFAAALMPFLCAVTGRKPFLSICAAEVLLAKTSISSAKACAALSFAPRPFLQTVEDTIAWYDSAAPR